MALRKPITFAGFTNEAGYFRVVEATVSRRSDRNVIVVYGYATQEEADKEGGLPVYQQEFIAPYKTDSPIPDAVATAYGYLKTLPEFADTVDV